VTVTLASSVKNPIDADDGAAPYALGDIRKATLTFLDRATGKTLCAAPIGLVMASDATIGVGACNFTAAAGTYTVETHVGGWYTRDSAADDVTLSVLKANEDFVTGAGYAQLSGSSGRYAAAADSRADFNLNPQYDAKSGNVKGFARLTYRGSDGGSLRVYEVDASAIASLAIVRTAAGGVAWITGTATLMDVTRPEAPVVIDGGATLAASFVDNGQPATNDTVAVTLIANDGALLFSSNWNGMATVDQSIAGGNIAVQTSGK